MRLRLEEATGLPVELDTATCELILGKGLNAPSYCVRKIRDLDGVWANPQDVKDGVAYRYTSGLWLAGDEARWKAARVIYGIVVFAPGTVGGEYFKSSGQYHPIMAGNTMATPEIYTVLQGIGHFLLQKSAPPYDEIEDAVLVEVRAGETFVVPPDYGHLQINPGPDPLAFSYVVMDGMKGEYEPFRRRRGAIYYEMAGGRERFVFNAQYGKKIPLRIVRTDQICQVPFLRGGVTYQKIRDRLADLGWLTDPAQFPATAGL